jgi:flagellar biosynthesis protein
VKRAIALRFDEETDQAPVVVSTGEGDLADRIERAALDYGVPVVHDRPLAEALSELEAGTEIPEELYETVALVLREIATEPQPATQLPPGAIR